MPSHDRNSHRYHAEVLGLFIKQTPINSGVAAAATLVVTAQFLIDNFLSPVEWLLLIIWTSVHLTASFWHYLRWRRSNQKEHVLTRNRFRRITRRAVWSSAIAGSLWGVLCIFVWRLPPANQYLTALVVASIMSGSVTTLGGLRYAAYAFHVMGMVPWVVFFIARSGNDWVPGILGIVYLTALTLGVNRVNSTYREAILARGAQRRLSRHLARLREEWLTVASVTDALALFDGQSRLVLWNQSMEMLLSTLPAAAMDFDSFLDLAPWQRPPLVETPTGQWSGEYAVGDGRYIQSILAQRGHWRVLCHRDVSALKARELSLEAERARAVRADRAKSAFLATMSHELRTPLNAIMGFSEVIRDGYVTDLAKISDYAKDIHHSAAHLLSIINDMLDIARIENAEIVLYRETLTMAELMGKSVQISYGQARRAGVTLHVQGGTDWPPIHGDRTRLVQAICNFLSNAIKASRTGQTVEVSAQISRKRNYLLTIKDYGSGISPERINDLFRPFATFDERDAYRSAGERGTGLGLAITKELLDAHGITIEVETEVGTGTAFTLDFTPCIDLAFQNRQKIQALPVIARLA